MEVTSRVKKPTAITSHISGAVMWRSKWIDMPVFTDMTSCVTYGFWTSLFSVAVNCSITIFFACYCISVEGWKLLYIIGLIEALIFCGLGWLLSGFTVSVAFFSLMSLILVSFCRKQVKYFFFFSCYMLQWTWQPMKCSTTKDTTTWRTAEVNITTLTQGGSFTIWLSFSCAFNRLRLRICQPLSY